MLIDLDPLVEATALPGLHPWVLPAAFHPHEDRLLVACGAWLLEVDLARREVVARWTTLSPDDTDFGLNDVFLHEAAYTAGGRGVVARLAMDMGEVEFGSVAVFDRERPTARATLHGADRAHGDAPDERGVECMAASPRDARVALGVAETGLELWDLEAAGSAPRARIALESPARAVGYSPDGARLAVATGGALEIRDADSGAVVARTPLASEGSAPRQSTLCWALAGDAVALVERVRPGGRVRVFAVDGARVTPVRDARRTRLEPCLASASHGLFWKRAGVSSRDTGARLAVRREGLLDGRVRRLGSSAGAQAALHDALARGGSRGAVVFPLAVMVSPDGRRVARTAGRKIAVTRVVERGAP